MPFIITEPCVGTCDTACVEVCPVDCIHGPFDKECMGEEAKAEGTKMIEQAQASIQSEKQAAIADLKKQVAELSIGIAEKVVRKELANDKDQSKLIEQLLKEVTIS